VLREERARRGGRGLPDVQARRARGPPEALRSPADHAPDETRRRGDAVEKRTALTRALVDREVSSAARRGARNEAAAERRVEVDHPLVTRPPHGGEKRRQAAVVCNHSREPRIVREERREGRLRREVDLRRGRLRGERLDRRRRQDDVAERAEADQEDGARAAQRAASPAAPIGANCRSKKRR
jgi:hypothetical protein